MHLEQYGSIPVAAQGFYVRGAYSSGTNLVDKLLDLNGLNSTMRNPKLPHRGVYGGIAFSDTPSYSIFGCWKHTLFPQLLAGTDSTVACGRLLMVISVRHPGWWLSSFYAQPGEHPPMRYTIQCTNWSAFTNCTFSYGSGGYAMRWCAAPAETRTQRPRRFDRLEELWLDYYSNARALADARATCGRSLIVRYEDSVMNASKVVCAAARVMERLGVVNLACNVSESKGGHLRGWPNVRAQWGKVHGDHVTHDEAVTKLRQPLRLPPDIIDRLRRNRKLNNVARSYGYESAVAVYPSARL